jgi:signal transduction histidine kinase
MRAWQAQMLRLLPDGIRISLSDPDVARIDVHHPDYQDNLGVQAVTTGSYVVDDHLYALFTPMLPPQAGSLLDAIQHELGIHQVVAVPFFRETQSAGEVCHEPVGNLFAITRSRSFRIGEIQLLQAFGQQAAIGVHNARLYRQSEDRRVTAQMFGRMAFSASASVHALKNHIGAIRLPLQLLNMALNNPDAFPETERRKLLAGLENESEIFRHLDSAADLLDTLHEPWRRTVDVQTDVNACIARALNRLRSNHLDWLTTDLALDLPSLYTAPDMLTEAFKVLIKNAAEALEDIQAIRQPVLQVRSTHHADGSILVTISDNGIGIRPENLNRVFEMRYTTKNSGLGFGLFWTRDYIEGLGGRLMVESTWQAGTTFSVILPAVQHDQGATASKTSLAKARGEAS